MIWIKRYIEKVKFCTEEHNVGIGICVSVNERFKLVRRWSGTGFFLLYGTWRHWATNVEILRLIYIYSLHLQNTEWWKKDRRLKMGHSSNFLYQGMLRRIFQVSAYIAKLKTKRKLVVSVHLIEQWCNEVDLFALKSDFCVIKIAWSSFTFYYIF